MGFLRTALAYAKSAWGIVTGIPGDVGSALTAVWKFIGAVHSLLDHLVSIVLKAMHAGHLSLSSTILGAVEDLGRALRRAILWVWHHYVHPVAVNLSRRVIALHKLLDLRTRLLRSMISLYLRIAMLHADYLFSDERKWRIQDVNSARAYSVRLSRAMLSAVQAQAASGYNSDAKARASLIQKIADDLAVRNPAVKALVKDFIGILLDAVEVDNPLLRIGAQFALNKVIDKLGIDKVMGDLLSRLVDGLIGSGKPSTLHGVTADIAGRLAAMEAQWADFMSHGGPDVEKAGDWWQLLGDVITDAALVGFITQAVADPVQWAREVNATAGAVVAGSVGVFAGIFRDVT
jgi:hypothetical protein